MSSQNAEFTARLARIEQGTGTTKATVFMGLDESFRVDDMAAFRKSIAQAEAPRTGSGATALPLLVGLLIGISAQIAWRLIEFHLNGMPGADIDRDQAMVVSGAMGLLIAVFPCWALRIARTGPLMAAVLGVGLSLCALHNAVHLRPDLFEPLFSAAWVSDVLTRTEPQSLLWGSRIIPIP